MKKQAVKHYCAERCGGGTKSKDFWPTIRPFLTEKGNTNREEIHLRESQNTISDQNKVCNIFNEYFVNVASEIGKNSDCIVGKNHPSIKAIEENITPPDNQFCLKAISEKETRKYLNQIGLKKAIGVDQISPKLLQMIKEVAIRPITHIVNRVIDGTASLGQSAQHKEIFGKF